MNTEKHPHVWVDLEEVAGLTRAQIEDFMVTNAEESCFEPCDINEFGRPEIYLRSKYQVKTGATYEEVIKGKWVGDGYVMFVKKREP